MKKFILSILLIMLMITTVRAQKAYVSIETCTWNVEYFPQEVPAPMESTEVKGQIMSLNKPFEISNNLSLIASAGISSSLLTDPGTTSIDSKFIRSSLSWNLGFINLNAGCGLYNIDDKLWIRHGLDGEEGSNYEFGLNLSLSFSISEKTGLIVSYNAIEPKEEESLGSMSLNGFSVGILLK